jgi:hypothetical protein
MTAITRSALTAGQQATISRAREALGSPSGTDTASLAERIGLLEYHVRELLALADTLAGRPSGQPAR